MSNPMIAVYPEGFFPPVSPEAADKARVEQAKAAERDTVFAELAVDVDFRQQMLNGWLREQEDAALDEVENCEGPKVVATREAWKTIKRLRQQMLAELEQAQQRVLEVANLKKRQEQKGPPAGQA